MLTQTTKYANVLAKIGAERGVLLSRDKLKALTENKNLDDFAQQLRETIYQEKIAKAIFPLTSLKFEKIFNENLLDAYVKTVKNSPNKTKPFLKMYLKRFELENIKTLIKAVYAELRPEAKLGKIYLGPEDYFKNRGVFEEAAKATDLKKLITVFSKTEYFSALKLGLKRYEETGSTISFDVLLDKEYFETLQDMYQKLPKNEKKHALFYVSMEVDSFAMLTLLRGKFLNYDAQWLRVAVPKCVFNLTKETLDALISAPDYTSALTIALKTHYSDLFTKTQTPEETIGKAEKSFTQAITKHAVESRFLESFNVGAPLSFMFQKAAEVHNLTVISLGIESGISPEEIMNALLLQN